jgi:hypothetical protein
MVMSKKRGDPENSIFALAGQGDEPDSMHWDDMPEFVQKEKVAPFQVNVRFRTKEDLDHFADLISQPQLKVRAKTTVKSTWFPRLELGEGGMDCSLMWAIQE